MLRRIIEMNAGFSTRGVFLLVLCLIFAGTTLKAGTVLDYDGDGRTDFALVRYDPNNPNFVWYILQSRNGFRATTWGLSSGQPGDVPVFGGDYDGDGKTDITVLRGPSNQTYTDWYILNSKDDTMSVRRWGDNIDDLAVPQDYDGDGRTDVAVYSTGAWYILQSSNNQLYFEQFGRSGDVPLAGGDYDGDGKADLAVVRYTPPNPAGSAIPANLYLRYSKSGNWANYNLGDARYTGVLSGDYDGDGKADVAIWQGTLWLWIRSSDNKLGGVRFGQLPGDIPVPGDYDGDGVTDPAVYRRGTFVNPQSYFFVLNDKTGFRAVQWGNIGDASDSSLSVGGRRYIPAIGF